VPQAFDCGEDRRFQSEDRAQRSGSGSKLRFSEQSIGVRHTTGGGLCGEQVPEAFDCGEDRRFQPEDRAQRLGLRLKAPILRTWSEATNPLIVPLIIPESGDHHLILLP